MPALVTALTFAAIVLTIWTWRGIRFLRRQTRYRDVRALRDRLAPPTPQHLHDRLERRWNR